jgi:protein-disulfide isomerase
MRHFLFLLLVSGFWLLASAAKAADAPAIMLGQANAPVAIDEYASLGCPHCADFDLNTLPAFKKAYIDTGKVKLIFHHFPLDKASVDAALMVQCVPAAAQWDAINLIYYQQDNWAHQADYDDKLTGLGKMLGLTDGAITACLKNDKLRDAILSGRLEATQKLQVQGTPTFIFNHGSERLMGTQTLDQMKAVLDRL